MELWVKVDVEDLEEPIHLPSEIFNKTLDVSDIFIMLCVIHNNVPCFTDTMSVSRCRIECDEYSTIIHSEDLVSSPLAKEVCNEFFNSSAYFMFRQGTKRGIPVVLH